MISAEITQKLTEYRLKQQNGTITLDELKEAVKLMRGTRVAASASSAGSVSGKRVAAAKVNINSDDLLADLENM